MKTGRFPIFVFCIIKLSAPLSLFAASSVTLKVYRNQAENLRYITMNRLVPSVLQTDSYAVLYCRKRAFYAICTFFNADIIWRLNFLWLHDLLSMVHNQVYFKNDILMWFDFNVFRQLDLKQKYQDVFLSAILDRLVQHEIGLFDFYRNTSPHTCLKLKNIFWFLYI